MFEADFEDGQAEADLLFIEDGGTWQVVSDETGNKVYETNNFDEKEDWSNVKFGSDSWENYVVEYSIKIPEFQPNPFEFQASLAIRRDSAGPTNYTQVLSLHPEKQTKLVYSQAGDWYEPENQITSYIFRQNFIKGEWYSFRIEAQGERIQVFLKDQNGEYDLITDVEDPKLTKGHLRFSVTPGTYAQFDNIRVYSLSPTTAQNSTQVHPDASKTSR